MPTMNTVKKGEKDTRVDKATVYDLAGANDWRQNTQGAHVAGPIDHVAKNKAAFSNPENTNIGAYGNYVPKGHRDGYQPVK